MKKVFRPVSNYPIALVNGEKLRELESYNQALNDLLTKLTELETKEKL